MFLHSDPGRRLEKTETAKSSRIGIGMYSPGAGEGQGCSMAWKRKSRGSMGFKSRAEGADWLRHSAALS